VLRCVVLCHAAVQVLASSSLQDPTQVDWRTVLPTIVSNMHDYFIAVAAKLERTHTEVRGNVVYTCAAHLITLFENTLT
jgi:hypothetical protein